MMFKMGKVFFVLLFLCTSFVTTRTTFAQQNHKSKALIVYENEQSFGYNVNVVNHLKELLHGFNEEVIAISLQDYKGGETKDVDSLFVINVEKQISNTAFLKDSTEFENNLYWIGNGIDDYLKFSQKYDVKFHGQNINIQSLSYQNREYSVKGNFVFPVVEGTSGDVLAEMSDGYNTYDFVINEGNLFYISRWDLGQSYIFEDTLRDFYSQKEYPTSEIFVRIEDVHPFRNPENLKEIADYLYEQNVPFMVALIPTYVDKDTGKINTLDKKPAFVEAIQYMQDKGGSILLHGYTHQLGNREISGEGYEYWDIENDQPIEEEIGLYVRDRLLSGLRLCVENGIYPLGFEAPHYAMNTNGYQALKSYVSTYVGQFQNNNESFTTSTFPYVIRNSENFNLFIPENLGYVDEENPFSVEEIKRNYEKLSIVRGYTGGFFFHPYLDIQSLKDVIHYLKEQDVQFLDLKNKENRIQIDDILIESKEGRITVDYDESKAISKIKEPTAFELFVGKVNHVVILFVSVVLLLFLIIFILFRATTGNKYTRRSQEQ